jgi:hypothetical protein
VNVYLVEVGGEFVLFDIDFEETLDEIVDLIRRMDFSLAGCNCSSRRMRMIASK